jgi:hypothetical protein
VVVLHVEARGRAHGAGDVGHRPAATAYEVVVVVTAEELVARDRPRRLDPTDESRVGEGAEAVVDGLVRDRVQTGAHGVDDRRGVRVRMLLQGPEHSEPWLGHAQAGGAQLLLRVWLHGVG